MTVVDLKPKRKRNTAPRYSYMPIDQTSGAGRFFNRMVREVEVDCGGKRRLSRIQLELVRAFCGAATTLKSLTHDVLLGETSEINLTGYATVGSTMLRIGVRLGLTKKSKGDAVPTLEQYLRQRQYLNGDTNVDTDCDSDDAEPAA